MFSCHSSTKHACSKCKDVIAMPAMSVHKTNCTLATFQLAHLKSVSTLTQHPMPAMLAHKGNLHHIAVLQPAPLMCVPKLQPINRTTVVLARIPYFAAYIIGQGWTAAAVSCDIRNWGEPHINRLYGAG